MSREDLEALGLEQHLQPLHAALTYQGPEGPVTVTRMPDGQWRASGGPAAGPGGGGRGRQVTISERYASAFTGQRDGNHLALSEDLAGAAAAAGDAILTVAVSRAQGSLGLGLSDENVVTAVAPHSAAAAAKLRPFDKVVSIDGQPLGSRQVLLRLEGPHPGPADPSAGSAAHECWPLCGGSWRVCSRRAAAPRL